MLRIAGTILQQQSWDNTLRRESLTRDIYSDFQGTFSDDKMTLPSGIIANVMLAASKNNHIVGLLKNISGAGVTGREEQLGKEKDQQVKELNVFSNDVSQALNTERYGIDAHDKEAYRILEAVQPQLSLWHKEIRGKYIREALLERYSINLTVAPTSQTKRWNENIFIKGVTFFGFLTRIGRAMILLITNISNSMHGLHRKKLSAFTKQNLKRLTRPWNCGNSSRVA